MRQTHPLPVNNVTRWSTKALCVLLFVFFSIVAVFGQATCSQTDVQNAIIAATDGSTVNIPAGNCTWSGSVSWANKNISVIGKGIGTTNITVSSGAAFQVNADTKSNFRISGMTLNIPNTSPTTIQLTNNTSTERRGFRFDHIRLNLTGNTGTGTLLVVQGLLWGLIDHVTIDANNNSVQALNNYAYVNNSESSSNVGQTSWETVPLGFGTDSAVYVEDSTFNMNGGNQQTATGDCQLGGRMVWRHNTIHGGMTMSHAAWDAFRGCVKMEIYSNTIDATAGTRPFLLRSGANLVFDNTVTGNWSLGNSIQIDNVRDDTTGVCNVGHTVCNGSQKYDGNTAGQTGWPCEDQIGRGHGTWGSQTSNPMYAWGNTIRVSLNGTCASPHVQANRDYFDNTQMPGYTPYTYPHPLQGSSTSTVNPPTGVTATAR